VFGDDFIHVVDGDTGVPDTFWINHHDRTIFALLEATCIGQPDLTVQVQFPQPFFQLRIKDLGSVLGAVLAATD
jgi:hypothetical protein